MFTLGAAIIGYLITRFVSLSMGGTGRSAFPAAGVAFLITGMAASSTDSALAGVPVIFISISGALIGITSGVILSTLSYARRHVFP